MCNLKVFLRRLPVRNLYHKVRYYLKSLSFRPVLFVGDTSARIFTHNWPTGMDIFNGSTVIDGKKMIYEPAEYDIFCKLAKNKKVFFDIGAHVGWYCLLAHGMGVNKAYAFEIVDSFASVCEDNFKLNSMAGEVHRVAVGIPDQIIYFEQSIYSGEKKINIIR